MLNEVQITFSPESLLLLNAILAFMMFGVSLTLKPADFKEVLRSPIAPGIGLVAQFLVLPALTTWMTWVLKVDPELALGMILVASCPGGSFSNIMTHIGRGNVAVSVSMTAVSSLAAIVMTPLNFMIYGQMNPATRQLLQEIAIDPLGILLLVTAILAVPLLIGMAVGHRFPNFARKSDRPFRILSLLVFFAFIVIAVNKNLTVFLDHMASFAALVVAHNALALSIGALAAYSAKLCIADRRAVTLEVGIQNSGLGLGILFTFFPEYGGMMIIAAFWGVWHLVSGLTLALLWSRRPTAREVTYANS